MYVWFPAEDKRNILFTGEILCQSNSTYVCCCTIYLAQQRNTLLYALITQRYGLKPIYQLAYLFYCDCTIYVHVELDLRCVLILYRKHIKRQNKQYSTSSVFKSCEIHVSFKVFSCKVYLYNFFVTDIMIPPLSIIHILRDKMYNSIKLFSCYMLHFIFD